MIKINLEATTEVEFQAFVNALQKVGFTIDAYISTLERLVEAGYVKKQVEATGVTYTLTELGVDLLKERLPEEWDRKMEEVISETLKQELERAKALHVLAQYGGVIMEEVKMGKKIEDLRWSPKWVTHLGCIEGCLAHLNIDVSDAWLYGATGHAFIINIHEVVCPSGPTAWNTQMLHKLGRNLGYTIDKVSSHKSAPDFREKQKLAWEKITHAIDEGLPCYGWEVEAPEFYVVYGYDDKGYYYRGWRNEGKGPKPWEKLSDTEIGVLEMYIVKPAQASDDVTTVKEAFEFVLEHSKSPTKWIFPKYKAGLAGFDNWIRALEIGKAIGFGVAYNAVVWSECRNFAVKFLKEAKERLSDELSSLFDEAIEHYEIVAQNLKSLTEIFPFKGPSTKGDEVKDPERCRKAIEHLRNAKKAEESGLKTLEKILRKI